MRLAGLDAALYHQTRRAVTLTLSAEPKNREIDARYRDEVATILSALRTTERLSTSEIADRIGRSNPAARKLLRKMRDASLIERRGKSQRDPRAYWCLADSSPIARTGGRY
jgi:DNA-binding MarR family transcriptional regulator